MDCYQVWKKNNFLLFALLPMSALIQAGKRSPQWRSFADGKTTWIWCEGESIPEEITGWHTCDLSCVGVLSWPFPWQVCAQTTELSGRFIIMWLTMCGHACKIDIKANRRDGAKQRDACPSCWQRLVVVFCFVASFDSNKWFCLLGVQIISAKTTCTNNTAQ